MKTVITFGTFDLLHVGHIKILKRAKALGDILIVGVSSDVLNFSKKSRNAIFSEKERMEIISSLKYVDKVFLEESLEDKEKYILEHNADILVMGDDWEGKFDHMPCTVKYFERTPSISTTELIEKITTI